MSHELQTIANAEDRNPHLEYLRGRERSVFLIDALRSSRKDQGCRRFLLDSRKGGVERKNLGENPQFPYLSGDELGVLGAEIKDNDLSHPQILAEEQNIVNAITVRFLIDLTGAVNNNFIACFMPTIKIKSATQVAM